MDFYRYICQFYFTVQIVWGVDNVVLLNPPKEPQMDHLLQVLYSCDRPAAVWLECVVSFETGTTSTILLGQWSCNPGVPKIRTLKLMLPDWLVYQADEIIPESEWVLTCILRVSVEHIRFDGTESSVTVQDTATLEPIPLLNRPVKQHQLCFAWSMQMFHLAHPFSKKLCPVEKETVYLLSSLYASTGETFGIMRTLRTYNSASLEYLRLKDISFPWCMFSIWIFVTKQCQESFCGVLQHINSDEYTTPTLLLTKSGHLHVQVSGQFGRSSAFLTAFKVPLSEWCRLTVELRGSKVAVAMVCMDKDEEAFHSAEHDFDRTVVLDDTEGYFVIGGGKYVRGVEGYFGPVVYYRNRIPPHNMMQVVVPDVIKSVNLPAWFRTCQDIHFELTMKITGYSKQKTESDSCNDAFHTWMVNDTLPLKCEKWEATAPQRRRAARIAKLLTFRIGERSAILPAVGRALYSFSLRELGRASSTAVIRRISPLLHQAGCLNNTKALHMLSSLYSAGLGVKKEPSKAWLLALLAAQKDDRLALLRLGHMHHLGHLGASADPDLAYAYYANIAQQTSLDLQNPTPQQTFVESVYLNNDELLKLQTREDHDIFQWMKLQAKRGVVEAEQAVGRMLFWGQQGVSPNIQQAVRHYERGAVRLEDPVSMYDYGIVLLKGQGVEQDIPKARTFLKKAMDQGFVPAISGLAWYFERFEQDYRRAVQLWEQADLLGNPDAAINLGVLYSQGLYPGKAPDQFMAYKYYLKAAERGSISGAINLAHIWATGIAGRVEKRPSDAVLWAKWAAEQNGYLGKALWNALDSYLHSDLLNSLLYYLMVAEAGYATAQFNVAYICDQNPGGFLDPDFAANCIHMYYNLTVQSQNPEPYALIRMGDLLYEGHGNKYKDLFSAAQMYKLAALRNEPQGWYSLGLLVEEGYRVPQALLNELGLSELYFSDNTSLLSVLYKKCRDSGVVHSYLPCSLALFKVHLQSFQKDYSTAIKIAVAMAAAPTVFFIVFGVFKRRAFSFI
ncbi:protein sel-1 homolog 3 [Thalassophryne amazonica]|uniref:protein sel-1 homolog 3 n=1 Tax=Thalassophryne amazonica TaxID=390379 RepID=UPI0014718696|nr:protein sel-1 homolog 3 [Thalassophryne amazonica]